VSHAAVSLASFWLAFGPNSRLEKCGLCIGLSWALAAANADNHVREIIIASLSQFKVEEVAIR
jgi:hypothetical protein